MSYYELVPAITQKCIIYEKPRLPDNTRFNGQIIPDDRLDTPLLFKTRCTKETPPDDCPGSIIQVYSNRFLDALIKSGINNLQVFDATLTNPDTGDTWKDSYKAVNVVGVIDCVDLEKSKYDDIGAGALAFREIYIDETRTNGALCFRVPQAISKIFLHKSVIDFIEKKYPALEGMEYLES